MTGLAPHAAGHVLTVRVAAPRIYLVRGVRWCWYEIADETSPFHGLFAMGRSQSETKASLAADLWSILTQNPDRYRSATAIDVAMVTELRIETPTGADIFDVTTLIAYQPPAPLRRADPEARSAQPNVSSPAITPGDPTKPAQP